MKKTIKPTFSFLIYENILTFPLLVILSIGLYFGITEKENLLIIICSLFICIFTGVLIFGIYETQWIKLDGDSIAAYNVFGLVKCQSLSKTKLAIYADIKIILGKHSFITKPFIVLSARKSVVLSDIYSRGNNRKKNPYIIIPYSSENQQIIKQAYFEVTGQELNIGL